MFESIEAWASSATDDELSAAIDALDAEAGAREKKRANAERHALALKFRRSILCPACDGRLSRDGGGHLYVNLTLRVHISLMNNKKGPRLLRYALIQAAQKVVLHYPKWAEYYRRKCSEGTFYKVALVRLAAKLLKVIWPPETAGLSFDESRFWTCS